MPPGKSVCASSPTMVPWSMIACTEASIGGKSSLRLYSNQRSLGHLSPSIYLVLDRNGLGFLFIFYNPNALKLVLMHSLDIFFSKGDIPIRKTVLSFVAAKKIYPFLCFLQYLLSRRKILIKF